jgi:hypothetical protein
MFRKKTLSRSCNEYEVDWENNLGHGVLDISRVHIVSFMGFFIEGELHPYFVCNVTFFQALFIFLCILFISFSSSNIECYVEWKEKNTTMLSLENGFNLKLGHIECYVQWKVKSTANAFPPQARHLFKSPLFSEMFQCTQDFGVSI